MQQFHASCKEDHNEGKMVSAAWIIHCPSHSCRQCCFWIPTELTCDRAMAAISCAALFLGPGAQHGHWKSRKINTWRHFKAMPEITWAISGTRLWAARWVVCQQNSSPVSPTQCYMETLDRTPGKRTWTTAQNIKTPPPCPWRCGYCSTWKPGRQS